jgi:hypothetical protein
MLLCSDELFVVQRTLDVEGMQMRASVVGIAVVVAIGLIWSVAVMSNLVPVDGSEMSLAAISRTRGCLKLSPLAFRRTLECSVSSFSPADYCERGKCVPAMFGVGVAPAHEELRNGSNKSESEPTSGHSTNYGSAHLVPASPDIGRTFS